MYKKVGQNLRNKATLCKLDYSDFVALYKLYNQISKKVTGHYSANYFHLDYLPYLINNIYSPPQVQKQPGRAAAEVHISNSFSYVFFNILFS